MTEENYKYRTSQTMLRNQFPGKGKLSIPVIPKFEAKEDDFNDLLLIGFDKTNLQDMKHLDRMVHFFLYDYKFERVWKNPDTDIERLSRYRAVLSPDFSMYIEMAPVMQIFNVFRNRWCGAYWASKGIRVIPTVNWGDESTFDFCFDGIEKGSTVAVSTYMASAHDNRQDQKEWFMAGYNEMLRRIEPERIICYNTPFPEMQGNIVYVDYELSSWKYMSYENDCSEENLYCFKIPDTSRRDCDIMSAYMISAGGGSAYGGKWRPAKPADERFMGKPGEIKITYTKKGTKIETKIGPNGYAVAERHHDSAPNPKFHSNPHDHLIDWNTPKRGFPNFIKPHINYWPDEYPNGAPEFKSMQGAKVMKYLYNSDEDNRFKTISEFVDCIIRGGEPVFEWNNECYGVCFAENGYCIAHLDGSAEKLCSTTDDVLEYMLGDDKLRDVVTKVNVIDRTL